MGDNNENSGAGRSLGGGAAEPLPASWANREGTRRVGRVGDWNNTSCVSKPSYHRIQQSHTHLQLSNLITLILQWRAYSHFRRSRSAQLWTTAGGKTSPG